MTTFDRATAIHTALEAALEPVSLMVRDDSAAHAGHAGAKEGGHYHVHIVSTRFGGLRLVARHRLVYDALQHLMPGGIHALAIKASTPEEVQAAA
jgi:BolA protein